MGRLVRLQELAELAGLPLDRLIAALEGEEMPRPAEVAAPPDTAPLEDEPASVRLDVRPMLAGGQEPFSAIMDAAAQVEEGGTLLLDAPFDPAPLRRVLAKRGFVSQGRRIADGHWRISFRRGGPSHEPAHRRSGELWTEADGPHLDVRGLEPPQPLVQILALIDAGEVSQLTVHHERDPVFLYPELEQRGWRCRIVKEVPGEIRLKLAQDK